MSLWGCTSHFPTRIQYPCSSPFLSVLQLPHTNIRFIPWHFCCSSAPRAAARGLIKWHGFRCGGGWSTTREFYISHHVFHPDHHLILFIHLQSSRQTCWIENCGLFFDTIQILILFPRGHKFTNNNSHTVRIPPKYASYSEWWYFWGDGCHKSNIAQPSSTTCRGVHSPRK